MSKELPGLIVVLIGFIVGLGLLTIAERYVLETFKWAEWPRSLTYPLISNVISGTLIVLGFILLFVLGFVGVIVAFDKGYESAVWILMLAVAAPIAGPLLMILVRFIAYRLFDLGTTGIGVLYSVASTVVILACSAVVILFFLLVAQTLGIDSR